MVGYNKLTIAFDRQVFVVFVQTGNAFFCIFVIKSTKSCNKQSVAVTNFHTVFVVRD